jgi:hypothetical protein
MDLLHMLLVGLVVGLVVAMSLLGNGGGPRGYIPVEPQPPRESGCAPVVGLLVFLFLTFVVFRAVGLPQLPIFALYG